MPTKQKIHVENNVNKKNNDSVHYIPCKIDQDCPANVEKYFSNFIDEVSDGMRATFRGHPLDGTKMSCPDGYLAAVLTETKRPLSEDTERRFQVVDTFKDFTYWNWDKKPSDNDNIVKALDWVDLAEAIHGDN